MSSWYIKSVNVLFPHEKFHVFQDLLLPIYRWETQLGRMSLLAIPGQCGLIPGATSEPQLGGPLQETSTELQRQVSYSSPLRHS